MKYVTKFFVYYVKHFRHPVLKSSPPLPRTLLKINGLDFLRFAYIIVGCIKNRDEYKIHNQTTLITLSQLLKSRIPFSKCTSQNKNF